MVDSALGFKITAVLSSVNPLSSFLQQLISKLCQAPTHSSRSTGNNASAAPYFINVMVVNEDILQEEVLMQVLGFEIGTSNIAFIFAEELLIQLKYHVVADFK
ncbi:unnamed protein product [Ilex paraguariensis]|uniref:Uncharacterized protein n=1 Tax=Ilex paraguariensis TaxID=185542 RepID=A0ABC8TH48_9AQUA